MSEASNRRAIGYIRISSLRQIDNESPETQRDKIQQYADANGIEIIKFFFDEAKSGKNADREELQNLLKFALQYRGKIDHVLVYKMSRASRNLEVYYTTIKAALSSKGITLRSVTEPMVDDTKQGRFMEGMLVLLAQLDNDSKSEYTLDNMRSLAQQGYWQHPPLVGYDTWKIPNELGKMRPTLKPNRMAPKVRQVLERYSAGDMSKAELTRYAEEVGLRNRKGGVMSEDSINRLLNAPEYAGFVHDKLTDYEPVNGKHEAIITISTFERNQQIMLGAKNSRFGELHIKENDEYILRGLLLCSNCKNTMYASAPRTGSGKYSPRYHCSRQQCRGKVASIKAETVHKEFKDLLNSIVPTEGLLKLYKTVLIREANLQAHSLNARIAAYRRELDRISVLRNSTVQKFVEGSITVKEKNELIETLDKEKLKISLELSEAEQEQHLRETDIEFVLNFMGQVDKEWDESVPDLKRRFQNAIFPQGLVYDSVNHKFGTSEISPLYRCVTLEKASEEALESDLVAGAGLEPATLWL